MKRKELEKLLSPNPTMANELVFSPLEDWTDDDVWTFLMQYKNPWGYSNMDLLTLYRGATADNECPMQVEKNLPSCGKSRFGCWVCTMVEKDKSMEAMIANDDEKAWMTPLLNFRNEFGSEDGDRERRSFRRMNGSLMGSYGRLYHGPYNKDTRMKWLKELLEIQMNIQQNGPEEFRNLELITIPELRVIRRIWVHDKHEFDDALPYIYKEVTGEDFDDPEWIGSEAFGKNEWEILCGTCKECYSDEELMPELVSSLIDLEVEANGMAERKDILKKIDTCIRKNFYKNEQDAEKYYSYKLSRQRDMDGKYNEKFFEKYVKDEKASYGTVFDDEDVDA